jgi:HD-GYP domain-containing protein (c-di-GMP phosphodiesterase class II)
MTLRSFKEKFTFELMLLVVVVGMACLLARMDAYKVVVLNLFYLPIILSGYFLGRSSAGVLALFSAIAVGIASMLNLSGFSGNDLPITVGLVITVWAATLGLTAILVGTLSDQRATKIRELHEAYVGTVDVLATYLQSADPHIRTRSIRTAEISEKVARELHLGPQDIDDVRVAALLHDVGNVQVTTRMLSKAVDTLESTSKLKVDNTFLGADLLQSLGRVMHRAVPLVLSQDDAVREAVTEDEKSIGEDMPVGARILRLAREYVSLTTSHGSRETVTSEQAIKILRSDRSEAYDPRLIDALERILTEDKGARHEPLLASITAE